MIEYISFSELETSDMQREAQPADLLRLRDYRNVRSNQ